MIKAVIFDMGGVLLRTIDKDPRTQLAKKYGLSYTEIDQLVFDSPSAAAATVGAIPEIEHWEAVGKKLALGPDELTAFQESFWSGDALNHELLDFIRSLRPAYKTAVLSNAWSEARATIGGRYKIFDAFDVVIFSAEVKLAKPYETIYQYTLDELGIRPEEALFVDDVPANIEAARRSGMYGVVYQNNPQAVREIQAILD
jgi:glucose-1-phosphatase